MLHRAPYQGSAGVRTSASLEEQLEEAVAVLEEARLIEPTAKARAKSQRDSGENGIEIPSTPNFPLEVFGFARSLAGRGRKRISGGKVGRASTSAVGPKNRHVLPSHPLWKPSELTLDSRFCTALASPSLFSATSTPAPSPRRVGCTPWVWVPGGMRRGCVPDY